ncbi:MAG: hypothetical protein JNJ90_04895 [Saprospiraceae bacterium]|jgi:hypothetical protein|nr:hypothetical protein [Saprospiraceae bacterium]
MRDLTELVHSLHWGKLTSNALWDIVLQPGTKMAQLFDILHQHKGTTEEEAATLLYGSPTAIAKLRSLKNKLKERLLEVVFLLDFQEPGYTDRQRAHYECNKRWATAMTLLSKKIKTTGVEQLELMLRHTQHFEFTELSMNAAHHLRLHYGTIAGDPAKYEQYRNMYRQYLAIWTMENEAEEMYTDLISGFASGSRAPQKDISRQAEQYYKRIAPHMAECESFRLHLSGRLLQLMIYSGRNDYRTMADLCEQALDFFRQKPYESRLPLQVFYYQLVVCCVQLRDFGRGQAIIRQNADIYEPGTFNWFKVQELYFLLALHTQHYDDAFDTCEATSRHAGLAQQPDQIREMWKIYEAYTNLLARIRRADRQPSPKFKMARFLNEIPVFSKDRRGMNIPVLVAQILYDIVEKRYDASLDRVEAVQKYTTRYLKKDEHFRSNCFLKMLVQIPEAAFHREGAARKAEPWLKQLRQMPLELANQPHEIEIIPYEDLWEMMLDSLPHQRVGRRRTEKTA